MPSFSPVQGLAYYRETFDRKVVVSQTLLLQLSLQECLSSPFPLSRAGR